MNLQFSTLLSILLFSLGLILMLSAITAFTNTLRIVVTSIGFLGIVIAVLRKKA